MPHCADESQPTSLVRVATNTPNGLQDRSHRPSCLALNLSVTVLFAAFLSMSSSFNFVGDCCSRVYLWFNKRPREREDENQKLEENIKKITGSIDQHLSSLEPYCRSRGHYTGTQKKYECLGQLPGATCQSSIGNLAFHSPLTVIKKYNFSETSVKFDDLTGLEDVKEQIQSLVTEVESGTGNHGTILLYGSHGSGKSSVLEATTHLSPRVRWVRLQKVCT